MAAFYGGAPASSAASSVAPGSPLSRRSTIAGPSASSRSRRTMTSSSSRFDDDDGSSIAYSSFPSTQSPVPPASTTSTVRPFPFSHNDTERSHLAYETLASSAKAYRVALGQLSVAASNFGAALETCARLKEARTQPYPPGPYNDGSGSTSTAGGASMYGSGMLNGDGGGGEPSCTADVLLATSGLYYLTANQQGILAETVYRSFELPIVHELDRYRADVEAEQESYAAGMREAGRDIRRLEKDGVKLRKPRQRDVGRMRSHLVAMTVALDALTARQGTHAVALLDQSRDMSGVVSQASRNLVRAELDILDSLARKGWPGGGLDVVLDGAVDLFSRNGYYDDDDDDGSGGIGGVAGVGGIGSIAGSLGSIGRNSSSAAVSGATDLGLGLGPKLLLLGGSGGPVSSRLDSDVDDDDDDLNGLHIIHRGRVDNSNNDEDEDDTLTISERRPRPRSQSRDDTAVGEDEEGSPTEKAHVQPHARHSRADSLTVGGHEYQSLDGVATAQTDRAAVVSALASASSRTRSPDGNGRRFGRARPFSPQRVAVDRDLFTGVKPMRSSIEIQTLASANTVETAPGLTSAEKEERSTQPTSAVVADGQGDTPPTEDIDGSTTEDADEGVQAWRQGL
ncbi:hypothetical protein CMQ_5367 [Grosmannia clavigera kw1407]|uniref:Phospholipid-binding protein n=1 Tax=Grosmannia clavigera (strain kw1407 / UAMH 11150) TaxID=655863 RepID=F0XB32_GROCL|nr:uncharacterized protein CMQ_5367 [Grosmannia clavigera kw1407]EFX05105.1 hypothetical protein CMQ_5367 [Grosmannia clavigera kw1407]